MSKVSNLEKAFAEQIQCLGKTQAEMLKRHFKTWQWNDKRITTIQSILDMGMHNGEPLDDKGRKALDGEKHRLVTENVSLWSHINRALKNTEAPEKDELSDFCFGD